MRALLGGRPGSRSWELGETGTPEPGPGELLVRVRAAGVNRADLLALGGGYPVPHADPDGVFVAGMELAGEVVAAGPGTAGRGLGDRVFCSAPAAFAEYAVVDARRALPIPAGLSWTDAAALPVALETAHDALVTQAGFGSGSVLVLGGTTGVGQVAIRLALALGADPVFATTTSPGKQEAIIAAGAVPLVGPEGLADQLRAATGDAGVDVVLDLVGGDHLAAALGGIRIGGTAIQVGRLAGPAATLDLNTLSFRRLRLIGTTFSVRSAEERAAVAAAVLPVLDLVADGRVRATVDRVVPFGEAPAALEHLRSGAAVGKVVLDPADPAPGQA
ncbi:MULTISPECIES: quinone oxidoreductase family protein [Pseudonocardia]|uniref:Mycocerosic acid synthase n=2 Tax=Pseudonocardia TaxID=1847 RepID=A0A1Y2MIZ7_PSEAH|nr:MULTISPECIES: zinc-binding dehydrogenase [Pseudonocardia]OSY35142.1 Mycocerosic acid synthase [Pseudonocardia autotrophica]TDN72126.1 NADPH:quinone reductase-like Zn-dependent oxidoreductase [Pseudonocardia autotrophica]BBG02833.1 NAD(P)H quinone oxidoreductase [Pseudonocardia autotrophica]GEC26152.1 NAD(P)H quinone oxidoreductase [Pseudonocardia saturnea]